ncbi:hypothetical protein [Cetobacterium sp.]|uniref:hypothetical protein n=1 Tax=Cetobacterium sp. TaxID=2071632 RepID=UPI003F358D23
MNKKILSTLLLGAMLAMTGCSSASTKQMRDSQTKEVLELQAMKREIMLLPESNAKQIAEKRAKLKTVNEQIEIALKTAQNAQQMENQQTNNSIKSAVTVGAGIIGAAAGIHQLTK